MSTRITDMTWPAIRAVAEAGAIAVLPTGSVEQHGRHLPTRTDTNLVSEVADAAVGRLEQDPLKAVLAPTLWVGASHHHREFFALSVSEHTYIDVIADLGSSLAVAGFKRIFIVNGHGGNTSPLRVALSKIGRKHPGIRLATADYWSLAATAWRSIRESPPGGAAHAGEIETSMMMHLAPESVQGSAEASVPDMPKGFEIDLIDGGAVSVVFPWREIGSEGHVGDPTVADPKKGKRFFAAAVDALSEALTQFHSIE